MFKAIDLPYSFDALEPHIDAKTMEIHHVKHYAGYTNNLNAALEGKPELKDKTVEELLSDLDSVDESIRTAVRNNGGGYANHTLFWQVMAPKSDSNPEGELLDAINSAFTDLDSFKEKFTNEAATRFGSGWAWLTVEDSKLHICSTPNQDTPLMEGNTPLLGIDVWEHAYYLNYQNRRADYIKAWWNVVNWDTVSENFKKAL